MARIEGPGAGGRQKAHPWIVYSSSPKPPRRRKSKGHKAKKGRAHKGHKAKTTRTTRSTSNAFHEQAGAGSIGGAHSGGALPFAGAGSTAGASARGLLELSGLDTATSEGLGGALLDLVGEGKLTVAHALSAWTHEQDRISNRAWRRPGGMVRMGGL